MMKEYQYKKTVFDWFPYIPVHWKVKMLKLNIPFKTGFTPDTKKQEFYGGDYNWVTIEDLNGGYVYDTLTKLSEEGIEGRDNKLVKKDSLLYSFKLSVGKVGFTSSDMYTNEAIASFEPNDTVSLKFLYYSLSDYLLNYAKENIYGALLLNSELIKNSRILIPPLPEQKAIAAYLDKACEKIDRVIAIKQEQIEKIENYYFSKINSILTCDNKTDAGKEFNLFICRKIPESWSIDRLRDIALINNDTLKADTDNEYELNYLDISNVNRYGVVNFNDIEEMIFEEAPSRARRITNKYDTIISSVRTNLQAIAYLDTEINNLICSTGFFVCRPKSVKKINPKYLYYFLLTAYSKDYFFAHSTGVSYPAINDYKFGSIKMFIPDKEEQNKIVTQLDFLKLRIDKSKCILNKQINVLQNYRKSLIHECVTGKKRVYSGDE